MVADGQRWLHVVGEDFGHKWSPTGLQLSVTGPLNGDFHTDH